MSNQFPNKELELNKLVAKQETAAEYAGKIGQLVDALCDLPETKGPVGIEISRLKNKAITMKLEADQHVQYLNAQIDILL